MSRKGKLPVPLPKGIEVKLEGSKCSVKGPKGTLQQSIPAEVSIEVGSNEIQVNIEGSERSMRALHGLYRALIQNMVTGVSKGFEVKLEMIGVGYRAAVQGSLLDLQIGLSHPTKLSIPTGVHVAVENNTKITISGANKQQIGQFAATVRSKRPPEPYQGKGIRYTDEYVRSKPGKQAAKK